MESLDIDSLVTNITLEETIDICANRLFENTEKVEGLSKQNLRNFYVFQVSRWSRYRFTIRSDAG